MYLRVCVCDVCLGLRKAESSLQHKYTESAWDFPLEGERETERLRVLYTRDTAEQEKRRVRGGKEREREREHAADVGYSCSPGKYTSHTFALPLNEVSVRVRESQQVCVCVLNACLVVSEHVICKCVLRLP